MGVAAGSSLGGLSHRTKLTMLVRHKACWRRGALLAVALATILIVGGCLVDSSAGPAVYATAEDAVRASGLDPSQLLLFGDHAALVHREADSEVALTAWREEARGWTIDGGTSTTREGNLSDAVIMGAALSTSWQVGYIYGYLPPGVASIESTEIPGGFAVIAESGAYVLILGDADDPAIADPQSIAWVMRDRVGHVVREGRGDCCPGR